MKKIWISLSKCVKSGINLTLLILVLFSCSHKLTTHKALTFSDVEKEFHFAKPLSEQSQKIILKKFGSVQNYHDSIVARKNNPYFKNIIISANPITADSVEIKVFRMTDEELKSKGIRVSRDSISNISGIKK